MPMQAQEIEDLLRQSFPDAQITVEGSDGVHMAAAVAAAVAHSAGEGPADCAAAVGGEGSHPGNGQPSSWSAGSWCAHWVLCPALYCCAAALVAGSAVQHCCYR